MKNRVQHIMTVVIIYSMIVSLGFPIKVQASDGEDYITISVDAIDDNPDLEYALDTDDPAAFSKANEFRVPTGTSHTIYVKDLAGNITSQRYEPEPYSEQIYGDEQKINIELELGKKEPEEDISAEETEYPGTASISSRVKTDGSVDSEKVFYTFTTKEGVELYLVVDQARGSDNVYLLDRVSLSDLRALADDQEYAEQPEKENEDNLLSILAGEETSMDNGAKELEQSKSHTTSSFSSGLLILLLAGIGGGIYYYLKVYRNKKDEVMDALDAMDMEDFEAEDEEDEEVEFDYDDAEKEKYLESLINDDEESAYVDADPEEYVMSYSSEQEAYETEESDEDDVENIFDDMEINL